MFVEAKTVQYVLCFNQSVVVERGDGFNVAGMRTIRSVGYCLD